MGAGLRKKTHLEAPLTQQQQRGFFTPVARICPSVLHHIRKRTQRLVERARIRRLLPTSWKMEGRRRRRGRRREIIETFTSKEISALAAVHSAASDGVEFAVGERPRGSGFDCASHRYFSI
jgi:hypothetical protein